jgi:hypothetical protein
MPSQEKARADSLRDPLDRRRVRNRHARDGETEALQGCLQINRPNGDSQSFETTTLWGGRKLDTTLHFIQRMWLMGNLRTSHID